ncbi:hypothetical protein VPH35_074333 [Triticum aestivum]
MLQCTPLNRAGRTAAARDLGFWSVCPMPATTLRQPGRGRHRRHPLTVVVHLALQGGVGPLLGRGAGRVRRSTPWQSIPSATASLASSAGVSARALDARQAMDALDLKAVRAAPAPVRGCWRGRA